MKKSAVMVPIAIAALTFAGLANDGSCSDFAASWDSYLHAMEDGTLYQATAVTVTSQAEAELAFADAVAAVYWPARGQVILLQSNSESERALLVTGADVLGPGKGNVQKLGVKNLSEFLENVREELSTTGDAPRYLLKLPWRGHKVPAKLSIDLRQRQAPPVTGQGIMFSESFETDPWTRWVRTDQTNGQYQFERTTCLARTGIWSLDAIRGGTLGSTRGCSATYPPSISTAAAYGQWLTFSGYSEAWLDLYLTVGTERDYDKLGVIFFDEQDNWGGWLFSGSFSAWFHAIFNLRQWYYLGDLTQHSTRVGLMFSFESDSTLEQGTGAQVDDVTILVNQNPGRTCSITATPTSGQAPLTVQFGAQTAGFSASAAYYWTFGDGTTSSEINPQHVFTAAGEFDVSVQITQDTDRCYATRRIVVTSAPPPPALNLVINQVDASACPTVKAYVSVFDANGSPVSGLNNSNFQLKEDGVPMPITVTQASSSERIALALVLDTSGSISATDLQNIKQAATTLVNMLGPNDLVALWEFYTQVYLRQDYTTNKQAVIAAINAMSPGGQTALYDAIFQAADHSAAVSGRKSMVVMTDGEDNNSVHSEAEAISKAVEKQIPVFTVGFGTANPQVLERIASQTGGVYYPAASSAQLQDLFRRIGSVIANQYLITWTARVRDGGAHNIEITVTLGGATATKTSSYSQAGTGCALTYGYSYYLPTVIHATGLFQSVWRSDVSVFNPSAQTGQVALLFYGTNPPREIRSTVNPGAQVVFADVIGQMGVASGSGMLEVKSTVPVKVQSRVFNLNQNNVPCYPGATLGQNIDAFTGSQALAAGQTAHLLHLAQVEGRFRTNILLANIGAGNVEVRLELFSENGVKLYEYQPITLAPKEARLEVEPFKTKANQFNLTSGYARVSVISGSGLVALASVVDSVTQDPTTFNMIR